jgi:hypothetical protein
MYPKLVIDRRKPKDNVFPSNRYVSFKILLDEDSAIHLPCKYQDLVEFCVKIASTYFIANVYGQGSANILEYKWLPNAIIVHGQSSHSNLSSSVKERDSIKCNLTTENIYQIKDIANPKKSPPFRSLL